MEEQAIRFINTSDVNFMTSQNETSLLSKMMSADLVHNATTPPPVDKADDAIWILTSTFIIFTMQSGFGLLESGSVSSKNEVNIMVKNAADVIFGGLSYWAFGYAISFGTSENFATPFNGWGYFFVAVEDQELGEIYSHFMFQASFATTATTIVSGSMAERTKLTSYLIFSLLNTIVYCFPAHWVWSSHGWLNRLGVIDVAGAGPVHLVGGVTGLIATVMLGPRYNRWEESNRLKMASPTNMLLGTFMLWWGWLGFNCGSTFGISGYKWILAARSAVATLVASVSGGAIGFLVSFLVKNRRYDVEYIVSGLLGSLVAITASCALVSPWEGFVIGGTGALLALGGVAVIKWLKVDDPVGVVGIHGIGAVWSLLAAGLFTKPGVYKRALQINDNHVGLFYGGGFYLLGVQALGCAAIIVWTAVVSFTLLKLVDVTCGLRVSLENELLGADLVEHGVNSGELPGDEEEQRRYIQLMLRGSPRGEGDGSLSSQADSELQDIPYIGKPTDNIYSDKMLDYEEMYRRLGLLYSHKKSHVFGSRVHKVHDVPAMMEYLKILNTRRLSDDLRFRNNVPLKRSSSLREFPADRIPGDFNCNVRKTLKPDDLSSIPSILETLESGNQVGFNNLGYSHESEDSSESNRTSSVDHSVTHSTSL